MMWPLRCAIITGKTDGENLAHPERHEIVEYRPRTARLGPDLGYVVNRQSRFNRDLLFGRINLQISVEAKVPHHSNTQTPVLLSDGIKAVSVHSIQALNNRSNNGPASRKSGMTTSAPTPSSLCRFHSSNPPEPLLASSLATATARPPTSLVF